jgi:hypothetical protein
MTSSEMGMRLGEIRMFPPSPARDLTHHLTPTWSHLHHTCLLTGGEVVTDELGMKMEKVELSALGSAKKITVTKVRIAGQLQSQGWVPRQLRNHE